MVLRSSDPGATLRLSAGDGLSFQFVLRGAARLSAALDGEARLGPADAFALPADSDAVLTAASAGFELLRVVLRLP